MKGKPIYFYVLLTLSTIGALLSAKSVFLDPIPEEIVRIGDASVDSAAQALLPLTQKEFEFLHSLPYRLLCLIVLALLVVTWYLLVRKNIVRASLSYLSCLTLNLIGGILSFISVSPVVGTLVENVRSHASSSLKLSLGVTVVGFLIFSGIILVNYFKYKKHNLKIED